MAKRTKGTKSGSSTTAARAEWYKHPEATTLLRPEVGTQSQFRKKKPPAEYRYDSSLSPALDWDGRNSARDLGEWLIARIEEAARLPAPHAFAEPREFKNGRGEVVAAVRSLADAVEQLKRIEKPFLNWAGKAERLSFDVPTLPLFVHERLSTKGILETLRGHRRDKQLTMFDLFGDPQHSVADQVLKAYEHQDKWQNRLILGDSLVVMNSLLKYEGLGGQVQMIYMDPPYGIKYGSNFQPFVRKRDVKHNDDTDMTREPEMVKAYRDTWELGLHSYLTYLRDRLLLCRELLHPSGSIFVQISDENLHHVRELTDEVFGGENHLGLVNVTKTSGLAAADTLATACDYLVWYAKDRSRVKYRQLHMRREEYGEGSEIYAHVELADGTRRPLTREERLGTVPVPAGARRYRIDNLTKPGPGSRFEVEFEGRRFEPGKRWWGTTPEGMQGLVRNRRLQVAGNTLAYVRFWDDFPYRPINNVWTDTGTGGFLEEKLYVVQTRLTIVERCALMSTDPGDLVLDPTCGSGTTAYVAEQWGRRWITIDTSRVPLALARQRLLTATFPYYDLNDEARGPAGGFVYKRKQNSKGEEVGGIVPHVTLKSIANNEPPGEEVLVDRPEVAAGKITRVSGPFVVEATIPTPIDWDNDGQTDTGVAASQDYGSFVDRMIEVLRRSPVLHVGGGRTVTLKNIRPPAKTLSLSAEAMVDATATGRATIEDAVQESLEKDGHRLPLSAKAVAIVFGPENGAVSEKTVYEAGREAHGKSYEHLYVIGFAIQPNARKLVDECEAVIGIPATYVQATPDLMMGDLLKNMRSSQIFSVCGLPEVRLRKADADELKKMAVDAKEKGWYQAELVGLDVFDPATMEVDHRPGSDVPCWMLDSDYNGLCFKATQAFFPRTAAWDDLKRSLRAEYDDSVWEHLAGTTSAPFQIGEQGQVAVKVIDDRGNELLVVKNAKEAD
jgi:adenine-specific DNA-methyltransferase